MDKGKLSTGANLLRLSTLGINFTLCILAGVGIGLLLRKFLNLGDWVVIAGFLFGVAASYLTFFKELKSLNQNNPKPPSP